jgi:hypothetical protein
MNVARLAKAGDQDALRIFMGSLDYAIRVARKFKYIWPVKFNIETLKVLKGPRKEGQPGQTDVGGVYAYVMLQAFDLTGEQRYLDEAQRAVQALTDLEFALEYQSNLTAWGAAACLKLWKLTQLNFYRDESYVLLAGFFHNAMLWDSNIGAAKHYSVFMGPTCLHDGPYMSMFECWESFAAFEECLNIAGDDLPAPVALLLCEYFKHTLTNSWCYFPSELPKEILSDKVRNGHIDRKLAFPLEDLYAGGDPAGQVGQEIYGAGAAFAFVANVFHRVPKAPFMVFCDYPLARFDIEDHSIRLRLRGLRRSRARLRLIPERRAPIGAVTLRDSEGEEVSGVRTDEGHIEFEVHGGIDLELTWSPVCLNRSAAEAETARSAEAL